jgi:hypothetical protein
LPGQPNRPAALKDRANRLSAADLLGHSMQPKRGAIGTGDLSCAKAGGGGAISFPEGILGEQTGLNADACNMSHWFQPDRHAFT